MKKIIAIILLAVVSAAAYSQEPNKQLQQLVEYLKKLDMGVLGVHYEQTNYLPSGVQHKWHVGFYETTQRILADESLSEEKRKQYQAYHDEFIAKRWRNVELAVDSVRLAFARLSKESSSSYLFENHRDSTDTIKYALAFTGSDGKVPRFLENKKYNQAQFYGAREAASFRYDRFFDSKRQCFVKKGSFEHVYVTDTGLSWEKDMKSFDTKAFQALIQPVIKRLLALKGAKALPIYWQHDVGYDDDIKEDGLISKTVSRGGSVEGQGITTGTAYFIPDEYRTEAEALHKQLDSLALAYVNQHPEQPYHYSHSGSYWQRAFLQIVSGDGRDGDDDYSLHSYYDKDGYYILSLTTKGDLWVPSDWPKLKSWINGEKVYLKGMKPKDKKK